MPAGRQRIAPRVYGIALACTCVLLAAAALADEPELTVSANRKQIYAGESVMLTVKIPGKAPPEGPDLGALRDCRVTFRGSHRESRSGTVYVNGRMIREGFSGSVFSYEITPLATGLFQAGPVSVRVDGKTLTADGPSVRVVGVEEQDNVVVRIESNRESVLVDEPFEVTLTVAIRRLPGRFANTDPLNPGTPPNLGIPYLDKPFPGLEGDSPSDILQELVVRAGRRPGFTINNYSLRGNVFDFGGFLGPRAAVFALPRRTIEIDGQSYFEYSLKMNYVPHTEGAYTFGPVILKGPVFTGVDSAVRGIETRVFAVGAACTVRVIPPPEDGRPPWYTGAIGSSMRIDADLDTQTCNVGDPLGLTLSVRGDVRMDNLRPPALATHTNLLESFRVYEDSVRIHKQDGGRDYLYTIRPTRTGTYELPPIRSAYYDPEMQTYVTVASDPIPIRVNEATVMGEDLIIDTVTNRPAPVAADPAVPRLVAPLDVDPMGAMPAAAWFRPWHAGVVLGAPCVYLLLLVLRGLRRHAPRRKRDKKMGGALARAERAIRHDVRCAGHDHAAVGTALCNGMRNYIADRFEVAGSALAPADAERVLLRHAVPPGLAGEFRETMERNYNAGFAGATDDVDRERERESVLAVMRKIDKHSGSKPSSPADEPGPTTI